MVNKTQKVEKEEHHKTKYQLILEMELHSIILEHNLTILQSPNSIKKHFDIKQNKIK
jgi:hypothetical protein